MGENCVWRTKQQRSKFVLLRQWPRGKVPPPPNAPFPTGRQNALHFSEIVKLTQNVRTKSNIVKQTTEKHLSLHKIHYLTGQESSQSFLLWTLQVNLSSVNSEEPFEVRHYLSKTLQLFTKSTGSASEWFLSTIYLSLVGLFPTVEQTKKAVISTSGLFIERKYAVSFNNLCRKYREPDLHCINKKPGYPDFKKKQQQQQPAILFQAARNTSHTLAHTHRRKQWKVSFNLPTLTIPALGPEALDFSRRLPRGRMVADKKERGF